MSRTEAHKMFPLHKDTNPNGVPISKDSQIKIFLDRNEYIALQLKQGYLLLTFLNRNIFMNVSHTS